MITEVIRRYSSDKGLETSTTRRDRKEYIDENTELNDMLGKFEDYAGRQFTYRNTFTNKNKLDVKTASLGSGTLKQNQIENYLLIIDNLSADEKLTLRPIRNILRDIIEERRNIANGRKTKDFSIDINKVDVIGDLDLKLLTNRVKIYAYWEEKHGEYKDFEDAYKAFLLAINDIKFTGELKEIIEDLKSYEDDIDNEELNYIRVFAPMQTESHRESDKHIILFEDILNILDLMVEVEEEFKNESDGESITVNTYGKDDERTGTTEEVSSSQRKGKVDKQNLIVLGRKLGELEKITVDPIYYVEFPDAFKEPTVVFKQEIETLKKLLLLEGEKFETLMNTNIDDDIVKYVNKLLEFASDVRDDNEFYLPLTKTTMSKLVQGREKGSDKNVTKIIGFLETFSKLFEPDDFKSVAPSKTGTRPYGSKGGDPKQTSDLIKPLIESLGNVSSENENKKLKSVNEELVALLNQVSNFFITPMYSSYMPFDDNFGLDVDTLEKRIFKIIQGHNPKDSIFSYMMSESKTKGYTKYEPRHIEELTEFLTLLTTPNKIKSMGMLLDEIDKGRKLIVRIADLDRKDKITKQGIDVEFGKILYNILNLNNLLSEYKEWSKRNRKRNPEGKYPNSRGRELKELSEEYYETEGSRIYPLNFIVQEIYDNRGSLEQTAAAGKGGRGSIIYEFVDIVNVYRNKEKNVFKKMLETHDNIRKMVGKPVYYNTSSLDNYDHINAAIDIMKSDYNVDISAHEISSIVNDIDSFGEIGIRNGVPKESVYFLKANFR